MRSPSALFDARPAHLQEALAELREAQAAEDELTPEEEAALLGEQ